jgi:hypothetical protein
MMQTACPKANQKKKPYDYDRISRLISGSRSITEAKQYRARSVFGWVTTVKSWFNLPLTKTSRVVYIHRVLMPEPTGAAI